MNQVVFSTRKAILAMFLGISILGFSQGISNLVYGLPLPSSVKAVAFGVLYIAIAYILVQFSCKKILLISLKDCHINKPNIQVKWLIFAFVLPIVVSSILVSTPGELIKNNLSSESTINIFARAIFVVGLGAGVVEELIFRGLIMTALEKRWGKLNAIVVPSIVFGLLHSIGMDLNVFDKLLLFIAGTSVGVMFSLIVYESGSIWASVIVHVIWNIVMIGGILDIDILHNEQTFYSYKLFTDSSIITGGSFGVEASIVAVTGYIAVIAYTLISMRKKYENKQQYH